MTRGINRQEVIRTIEQRTLLSSPPLSTRQGISRRQDSEAGRSAIHHILGVAQSHLWLNISPGIPSTTLATLSNENKSMDFAAGHTYAPFNNTVIPARKPVFSRRGGSVSAIPNISISDHSHKPPNRNIESPDPGNFMDSPTIPGRPPLRALTSTMMGHERSCSAPGNWRDGPFGDAMVSCVDRPSVNESPRSVRAQWATILPSHFEAKRAPSNATRQLCSIFSPGECTTPPTTAVRIPMVSPRTLPDRPPKVPPKSPNDAITLERKQSLTPKVPRPRLKTRPSKASLKSGIETIQQGSEILDLMSSPPNSATSSPTRKPASHGRSLIEKKGVMISSDDTALLDVSKSPKRTLRRQKSQPALSKASESDAKVPHMPTYIPTGLRPTQAVLFLPEHEKTSLRKQAAGQAEQFEVLEAKHVVDLSRELRALDERCEYLRRTYKSLRSGRQKLHVRMISYLKSESLIFSRERLLKQQESLVELDRSIDDWTDKLERAENRRLRLRQKLLEHVAAAMALNVANQSVEQFTDTTPPRSPIDVEPPKPLRVERNEVESIKIYADNQVLNLFNDIEEAVTNMCESC